MRIKDVIQAIQFELRADQDTRIFFTGAADGDEGNCNDFYNILFVSGRFRFNHACQTKVNVPADDDTEYLWTGVK